MHFSTQLVIRACKSRDPERRLRRLYKRIYLDTDNEEVYRHAMIGILADICDRHLSVSISNLITDLDPTNIWSVGVDYRDRCLQVLTSKIRAAKRTDFEGLTPPAKFRKTEPLT